MNDSIYLFYECENANCGLRFPGYSGYPRWNRCPVCRSNIHVVAKVNHPDFPSSGSNSYRMLPVEVLLDNIRSAFNVGSIFRTSDGAGVHKIYCCGISPDPDNSRVRKTALGAEETIPWEKSSNGLVTAEKLKLHGSILWALEDLPGAVPLFQVNLPTQYSSIILVVGNEITGVDPGIIDICNKVITIPMVGVKSSYNVAIAFSIAISFLFYRQNDSQESLKALPNT